MPNVRELEDLIIDAIYQDILRGKLDQKEEQLEVEYTVGRDVEPASVEGLLVALQNWYVRLADASCFWMGITSHKTAYRYTSSLLLRVAYLFILERRSMKPRAGLSDTISFPSFVQGLDHSGCPLNTRRKDQLDSRRIDTPKERQSRIRKDVATEPQGSAR